MIASTSTFTWFAAVILKDLFLLLEYEILLPTTAQQFSLLLHVSGNHNRHHQGVTLHRRAQRTVCQWMAIKGKAIPLQAWTGRGVQEVVAPRFQDSWHMKEVRLPALRTGRLCGSRIRTTVLSTIRQWDGCVRRDAEVSRCFNLRT
jgi:hypothetical protein